MIVFGTEDIGPLKYLVELKKWIVDTSWIVSKNTESFLIGGKIISQFELKAITPNLL